jgi:hypothetical protein
MRYAQITSGRKLHLVYEAGEGRDDASLVAVGCVSAPICATPRFKGKYRMTINVPLRHACKNCLRVWRSRYGNNL